MVTSINITEKNIPSYSINESVIAITITPMFIDMIWNYYGFGDELYTFEGGIYGWPEWERING